MWYDKLVNFIRLLEPILLVVVPTIYVVYLKVKKQTSIKVKEYNDKEKYKAEEQFLNWEHTESMKTIDSIRHICNYYKDVNNVDRVNFIQFENGTVATSKICNMFLTCLSEDTRFGKIASMLPSIQRMPYSKLSTWVNSVRDSKEGLCFVPQRSEHKSKLESSFAYITNDEQIKSYISGEVKDAEGILIGFCSFFYSDINYNGETKEDCETAIKTFIASVEYVLREYQINKKEKKKELKI